MILAALNYCVSVLYFQSFGHWLFGKQRYMNMDGKQGDQQCEARLRTDTKTLEHETEVHTVCNHGEGPYLGPPPG